MANIKQYTIQINGIEQSISAVESLNAQLNALEARINALASKQVNISTKSTNSTSALNEEDKLVKQIQQTEEKIKATRSESYQQLLAEKDLLKETVNDQKERAAQERLVAGTYSNTMKGLKEELADIKSVMQTTDLGDEKFKDLVGRAGQLTNKLKELEQAYGQFGRNVGNYASAAEGFGKFTVKVGDTVREFSSAREAARQLRLELLSLGEGAEGIGDLKKAINSVDSAIKDATVSSEAMDEALDMAQSFIGMAQAGQGLAAFFGLEGTGVEETIKNLVALQSALNGIETLSKQMNTSEGIGKYFSSANEKIDNFTNKLFGVKKTIKETAEVTKQQASATSQVATASNAATTAEVAQTTATAGLTVGMRAATVAARTLGMALKAIGIGILLEVVSLALDGIKKLASSIYDAFNTSEKQIEALNMQFNALKQSYSYLIEENNRLYDQGNLSYVEYMCNQLKIQNDYLRQQIDLQKELNDINGDDKKLHWYTFAGDQTTDFGERITQGTTFATRDLLDTFSYTVDNLEEAKKAYEELNTAVRHGNDYLTEYGSGLNDYINSLSLTVSDTKDLMTQVGEGIMNDLVARIAEASNEYTAAMEDLRNGVDGASDRVKAAKKAVEELEKEMNEDSITSSIIANLDTIIPDAEVREKIMNIIGVIKLLKKEMNAREEDVKNYFENLAIEMLPEYERTLARIEQRRQEDLRKYGETEEQKAQINAYFDKEIEEATDAHNRKMKSKRGTAHKQEIDADKTLYQLKMRVMEDGLTKKLMQLDEEKRQTLNKLKSNQTAYLQAERLYEQIRLREIEKFIESLEKAIADSAKSIKQTKFQLNTDELEAQINNINQLLTKASYNTPLVRTLVSESEYKELTKYTTEERLRQAQEELKILSAYTDEHRQLVETEYAEEFKILRGYGNLFIDENKSIRNFEARILTKSFEQRLAAQRDYQQNSFETLKAALIDRRELMIKEAEEEQRQADDAAKEKLESDVENLGKQQDELLSALNKLEDTEVEKRAETQEKVYQLWTQMVEHSNNYLRQVELNKKNYDQRLVEIDLETAQEMSRNHETYFNTQIANFRDFNSKLSQEISKQPIYDKAGFGIINLKATRRNFKEIEQAANIALGNINDERIELSNSFQQRLIKSEAYNAALLQLNDLESTTNDTLQSVQQKLKELGGEWWGTINEWIQQVGQAATQILSSISEITSNQYDEQISQQEKYIEEYEKLLDKQKEKTQEYADAVSEIENELSNARGDRRQQLIDNLNAEMAAQRASLAQEKKIEKERDKADEKRKELEQDKAEAEKRMQIWQAGINAAMAVSMAAVNHWPVPAIPMMAMAAAVGAAQIAAVASKPIPKYGDGGVIVGRSHKEGGVPAIVGNGYPVELEGQEYIIRKKTATQNIGLLDFVNKSEKKLRLEDFIDFYGSNSQVQKNVTSVRKRFENGGAIPSLRTDISINDRVLQAIEDYSNRPTIVSVVDIIDQTERLNEVKTISGLYN